MKNLLIVLCCVSMFVACSEKQAKNEKVVDQEVEYASFGAKITEEKALSKEEMANQFDQIKAGDTISVKFSSKVNSVCKAKGCWMKLDLGEKESMVKFKDYEFFVPLNSEDKNVIVEGKAFISEVSVKELQHYAKDAGKSEEEIAQIVSPKITYSFEATGVLMEQ